MENCLLLLNSFYVAKINQQQKFFAKITIVEIKNIKKGGDV